MYIEMSEKPKFLYWLTNRGAYRSACMVNAAANIVSPNSGCVFNMSFRDLPQAPAYILKLEQFSINNTGQGNVFDCPLQPPLVAGTQCPTGLIEFAGFNPHDGSLYQTSSTALPNTLAGQVEIVPPARRCILTRFDTSFISKADIGECSVAPAMTPSVLVHRPTDGDYTFWIRGIINPYGILVIDNGAGNRRQPIGDWGACISLTPMTQKEVDKYYNINQCH